MVGEKKTAPHAATCCWFRGEGKITTGGPKVAATGKRESAQRASLVLLLLLLLLPVSLHSVVVPDGVSLSLSFSPVWA